VEDRIPEYITPTVLLPSGETYAPPGWMWVLAFAIAGCPWAVAEIESGKFDGWLQEGAFI